MEQQIRSHFSYLDEKTLELERLLRGGQDKTRFCERVEDILDYHKQKIRHFQHERLVHLFIMLFFALLLLLLLTALFLLDFSLLRLSTAVLLYLLTAVVLVVEVFYIRHYYFLETKIQELYLLENRLYEMREATFAGRPDV